MSAQRECPCLRQSLGATGHPSSSLWDRKSPPHTVACTVLTWGRGLVYSGLLRGGWEVGVVSSLRAMLPGAGLGGNPNCCLDPSPSSSPVPLPQIQMETGCPRGNFRYLQTAAGRSV